MSKRKSSEPAIRTHVESRTNKATYHTDTPSSFGMSLAGKHISNNPLLRGITSLLNIPGKSLFEDYLEGDNAHDLRSDWEVIGADMRKGIRELGKY